MIKSFKIDYNGIEEPVEYEDDITFGELEAILNQCLDMTKVNEPKVNLPLYRQLILTTVITKAPFELKEVASIRNLKASVAKKIMKEVMKDYPLAKYLEEWVETFVGADIQNQTDQFITSSQGNSVGQKDKLTPNK
ncbi:MAG: hypothetical protein ACKVJ1_11130 [Verrucomicrobiia bacterium]|tara:strand:+ start:434 stop:841 length:408 start_codon:yes stop_codon:yes gene_type:complete